MAAAVPSARAALTPLPSATSTRRRSISSQRSPSSGPSCATGRRSSTAARSPSSSASRISIIRRRRPSGERSRASPRISARSGRLRCSTLRALSDIIVLFQVFAELVPGGKATLVIQTRRDTDVVDSSGEEDSHEEEEEEAERRGGPAAGEEGGGTDRYTGVGIKVSFTGTGGTVLAMTQLSGGQQTIVALALIFAIQRCDPFPFYLFDEIDSNAARSFVSVGPPLLMACR